MNVYLRELRASRRSLILWCAGMFLFILASMGKYAAGVASGQSFDAIIGEMPPALQALFGTSDLTFSKASGFYGMIYLYLLLLAAIHASMLGAVIISKEERDRTSEFLFVKPVTRTGVITSKLLAALTCAVVLNLVTWASSVWLVGYYGKGEDAGAGIARLMAGMFFVQLVFLSVGAAAAATLKRPKGAAGIAAGIMLAAFFLDVAIDINGKIDWLKFLSPFEYFNAKLIIGHGEGLSAGYIALCAALTAALTAAAYVFFRKRDLRV